MVGEVDCNDLIALKRVGFIRKENTVVSLVFFTPEDSGRKIYTLYIMSDIYQGLDQQYDLYFDVLPALTQDRDE